MIKKIMWLFRAPKLYYVNDEIGYKDRFDYLSTGESLDYIVNNCQPPCTPCWKPCRWEVK